jgi:hypothetical protein
MTKITEDMMNIDYRFNMYIFCLTQIKHDHFVEENKEIVDQCDNLICELRALKSYMWKETFKSNTQMET